VPLAVKSHHWEEELYQNINEELYSVFLN